MKSKPKGKWHLMTAVISPEMATQELNNFLKDAQKQGNDKAEGVIQIFESIFSVPESLSVIKDQKILLN